MHDNEYRQRKEARRAAKKAKGKTRAKYTVAEGDKIEHSDYGVCEVLEVNEGSIRIRSLVGDNPVYWVDPSAGKVKLCLGPTCGRVGPGPRRYDVWHSGAKQGNPFINEDDELEITLVHDEGAQAAENGSATHVWG